MRQRIPGVLAALVLGLTGAALLAAPAYAVTGDGPAAIPTWSCGPGEVRVDPNGHEGPIRVKVGGEVAWSADTLAEAEMVPVEAGDVVAEVKVGGEWKQAGDVRRWTLPGWCKPVNVKVDPATCRCLDMVVTVTNPNAKGWIWVRLGDGKAVKLAAGKNITVKTRVDVTVSAGWNPKWLKVVKTITYKAPECATPTPSASPSSTPSPTLSPSPSPTGGVEGTPTPTVTTPAATTPNTSPAALPSFVPVGNNGGGQPRLPTTGASVTGVVAAGGALIAAGVFVVLWSRRRRTGPKHFAA